MSLETGAQLDIRVWLADDQVIIRKAMHDVLIKEPDVAAVALANDVAHAVEISRTERIDVAVLDMAMPGVNGYRALAMLKQERPSLPLVMLSLITAPLTVQRCLRLGASGYVTKQSAYGELIYAIRAALVGETYLCRIARESLAAHSA
jgi:DNA-binding NarL/FixJ family response regulator